MVDASLAATRDYWEEWSGRCTYEGPYREAVLRSADILTEVREASEFGITVGEPTVDFGAPVAPTGTDEFGVFWDVPVADDTQSVGIIIHTPGGDSVPTTREPGGNQLVVPLEHPEVWFKAGDATKYFTRPPT